MGPVECTMKQGNRPRGRREEGRKGKIKGRKEEGKGEGRREKGKEVGREG